MNAYANVHLAPSSRCASGHCVRPMDPRLPRMTREGRIPSQNLRRVLILGPENSGKTTVSKILVNYATRAGQGWKPMLVNVDPGEVG